jgi:hypothetical protein
LIHPTALENPGEKTKKDKAKGITIRPYRPVLPGHLWIGVEDKN